MRLWGLWPSCVIEPWAPPCHLGKRLSLTPNGHVRYQLKTPYRDGATHVVSLRASCPPSFAGAAVVGKSSVA